MYGCLLLSMLASCGGTATDPADPTDPTAAKSARGYQLIGAALPIFACQKPLRVDSGSAVIGASGGQVSFGPHQLTVPAGALRAPTRISARAAAGDSLVVDLEPHGLQFAAPVTLSLSYKECVTPPKFVLGMLYTNAAVTQVLSVVPAQDQFTKWAVVGTITHFSVYAASETRKPRP